MKRKRSSWASDGKAWKADRDDGLLPCPWCGKVPKVHRYALFKTREMRYGVWCHNGNPDACPMTAIETLPFATREEAISAWNKRA